MNNITRLVSTSADAAAFAGGYFRYLAEVLTALDTAAVAQIVDELETTRAAGHTIFIAGNGGSAATASHMVNDLVFGTRTADGRPTFRAVSLSDATSLVTAIANDVSYEQVFVWQLQQSFRPGDRLIVISASGHSPNILAAAQWARANGGRVIGLLGFDGGAAKALCDVALTVATPKGEYGPVEDVHMAIDHILTAWLQHRIAAAAV